MFLVSTRLGLIACRYLVDGYYQGRYVSAPEIAEKYNMNVRALMPALRQLTRSGILRSRVGGKEPGFMFSRNPREISMLDVISSLEGTSKIPCCKDIIAGLKCECTQGNRGCIYNLFNGMMDQMNMKLGRITVEEHTSALSPS